MSDARLSALSTASLSAITAKAAPCGSVRIAKRPTGRSIGPIITSPPRSFAWATVASVSSTAK